MIRGFPLDSGSPRAVEKRGFGLLGVVIVWPGKNTTRHSQLLGWLSSSLLAAVVLERAWRAFRTGEAILNGALRGVPARRGSCAQSSSEGKTFPTSLFFAVFLCQMTIPKTFMNFTR